jgi:HAD superfamily phosphatase (TIGR01681 family)
VDASRYTGVAVFCEWYDLDPRLGFRRLGGWAPSLHEDILTNVEAGLARLRSWVERLAGSVPVAVALPTLPIAPIEISAAAQALNVETSLWAAVWNFAEWCVSKHRVRLLSMAEIDRVSPPPERFDLRSEIGFGSPYALPHASVMAELLSRLLAPAPPLKGLITDLDGTLWRGVLGEVGAPGVSFTLDSGGQIHGLYQQLLESLAERGVPLAIASNNDAALVEDALSRPDLLVQQDRFFPVVANWGPKSESVRQILSPWNIGPEAVAFIDDSPMEVEEVRTHFPQIRTVVFRATGQGSRSAPRFAGVVWQAGNSGRGPVARPEPAAGSRYGNASGRTHEPGDFLERSKLASGFNFHATRRINERSN